MLSNITLPTTYKVLRLDGRCDIHMQEMSTIHDRESPQEHANNYRFSTQADSLHQLSQVYVKVKNANCGALRKGSHLANRGKRSQQKHLYM